MQIHELNTISRKPGASDYLAIDDGSDTMKVSAEDLGVTTQMTQAEAEAGTSTESRVVSPQVMHDVVEGAYVLKLTGASAISSLPYTFTNENITTDMVCIKAELGTPSAQTSDWTVNTDTAGQAVISGSISGSTTLTLYLAKSR